MKTLLIITYFGLLILLFFGLPQNILNGQSVIKWTAFLLIFFVQTFLLYKILTAFKISFNTKKIIVALSVLIIGPLFGFYSGQKTDVNLRKYGIETKGIVYEKWYKYTQSSGWLLRCNFQADGKTYSTFSATDQHNKYKVGDTLTILYNSQFPQECIIEELDK